jgi:predicted phosphate transport protein (TIGR00153 family)
MAFRLIPKDESFYDMFEQLSGILVKGADVLVEAMARFDSVAESAKRLERLEHDGDQVTHDIIAKLNRTFITPIDREDIHRLASDLDDVLDLMEAATERFILYRVTALRPEAEQIARVIQQQSGRSSRCSPSCATCATSASWSTASRSTGSRTPATGSCAIPSAASSTARRIP